MASNTSFTAHKKWFVVENIRVHSGEKDKNNQ